jgi:hypothetical protein
VKASDSYRIKLGACAALMGGTLVVGAALAIGAGSPATEIPVLAGLGVGAEARADWAAASTDTPLPAALAANRAVIDAAPMTAAPWLRIAYLRSRNGQPLDGPALEAIERSYTVAPFGADVTAWRLTFLYDHWSELTPDIRAEVTAEHLAAVSILSLWKPDVVKNPAGRMAATFTQARGLTLRAKTLAQKP